MTGLLERHQVCNQQVVPGPRVYLIRRVETHGEGAVTDRRAGLRGHRFAKRVDAPYKTGRQPAWVKIKNHDYSRRAAVEWQGR